MSEPRWFTLPCLSPAGFHRIAYAEWGEPDNPRVLVCVHGLARNARDFDRLAQALAPHYRVVCPDVVGRGRSEWLRDPMLYGIPQYARDLATLVARLDVPVVDWVGTSMGGLIGIALAGQPGAPIGRLVINDVGPTLDAAALARIGAYVGEPVRFASVEEAVDYTMTVAAPFALGSRDAWRELTIHTIRRDGAHWVPHYDPAIAVPFRAITPEAAAAGEAATWALYDAICCPTLLLRGERSDLLSHATAEAMTRRGPRARLIEVPGVGHAPMFQDEAQIALVRDFLLEDSR